ncbi:MAG TPA: CDP-glucose 4,6-dehydratase [Aromatoleum sp.]|uniref:CDP-glucose 4,6-dehydratase n=1 Tax=Aromatoleum sp. TaxID=2307007 RepID=UPI002B48694B|nr:CDP-glucose 4,6-dehydratase [Aromatoleum sp.]HJV26699.1 CDP-glucose 4,6-dehydratase [Aromatoleum sp.]
MESLAMSFADYAGRRVLLTGHTGFKGGWLALWLERLGATVCGLALPPDTNPSLFDALRLGETVESNLADIRDVEAVKRVMTDTAPEIVFHLAAQPLVRHSYIAPIETLATNVMGTAHVLEAARNCPSVRAIVVVTTDKCYENRGWDSGYRESDRLGGHDPYSVSKACAELVASAWRSSYWQADDAPLLATARAGNVIGGGDWAADRLVPDVVRAIGSGQIVLVRNPAAIRPWQHVLEPLAGYLMLGARLLAGDRSFADAWNFGPALGDMQSVSALCEVLCKRLGGEWRHDEGEHPHEAAVLRLDSSHAMLKLGWAPRWTLVQALELTADWYARASRGEDARALTLEQVSAYEAACGVQQ